MKIPRINIEKEERVAVGIALLVLAAAFIAAACNIWWGVAGALMGLGVFLVFCAIISFASSTD